MPLLLFPRIKALATAAAPATATVELAMTGGATRLDGTATLELQYAGRVVETYVLAGEADLELAYALSDLTVQTATNLRGEADLTVEGRGALAIAVLDTYAPLYVWRDPDGIEHPLDMSEGVLATVGKTGLRGGTYELKLQTTPFRDGARLRRVVTKERDVDLPIVLKADTPAAFEQLTDRVFGTWFSPRRGGPGALLHRRTSGARRELVCWPEQFDADLDDQNSGPYWQRAVIGLKALDGYWQDEADATTRFVVLISDPPRLLDPPVLPLKLASDDPLMTGSFVVDGPPVWPVWTVEGPLASLELRNATTGESLVVEAAIPAGQTYTIDTRPSTRAIRLNGESRLPLAAGSTLWGFEAIGAHTWTAKFTGAVSGVTALTLAYRRRFETE